jgi:uncharacterized protein with HEPN domain
MESISFQQLRIVEDTLSQIQQAISNLEEWNASVSDVNDLLSSPSGMKTLAADCMLIEAIGEGVKRIDERTEGKLLSARPEIPWQAVKGMRNHIAHGYFDINADLVWDVVKNDLPGLRSAIDYLKNNIYDIIPIDEGGTH